MTSPQTRTFPCLTISPLPKDMPRVQAGITLQADKQAVQEVTHPSLYPPLAKNSAYALGNYEFATRTSI